MYHQLRFRLQRLAAIGNQLSDTQEQKLHNHFLIYMALLISGAGILWGTICIYYRLLLHASIPYGYFILTVLNLWYFSVSKRFKVVRFFQVFLSLLLPFLFQWSFGGFMPSGAVMLWAMTALLGSLTFQEPSLALRWFLAYLLLTVISGIIDSNVLTYAPPISSAAMTLFFVINIIGVSAIVFGLMQYFVRSRALAHAELELKNRALVESQAQLIQAEKMASLGQLTAGIAHEINSPVGAISSMHDTLMRAVGKLKEALSSMPPEEHGDNQTIQAMFKVIADANKVIAAGTERVTSIVGSLRSFARLDEAEFQVADLKEGIESTLALLQAQIGVDITIIKDYGDIRPIYCSPSQLNQAFMHLLNNAIQAIEGSGEISIRTFQDDSKVYIQISDTGVGIPSEQLEQVFDPSFRMTDSRMKLGLGLSTVYNIVQGHEGEIRIESEVGKGTEVTISLPIRESNLK